MASGWLVRVPSPTTYAALHSSYHFGELSLIPKLRTPALCIGYYDNAVLLLILISNKTALINATCAGTRLYR